MSDPKPALPSASPPSLPHADDPAAVHRAGEAEAAREALAERRRASLVSNARLAVFTLAAILLWLAFGTRSLAPAWAMLPVAGFAALVVAHDRVLRRATRAERLARFHANGLARLEHRFAGQGDAGLRYFDPAHPYARDLDLFGRGSLYEQLATTATAAGADRLAAWLLAPASPEIVRARQQAIAELRTRLDLRIALALLGEADPRKTDAEVGAEGALAQWASPALARLPRALPYLALAATTATLAAALLVWRSGSGPVPVVFAVALEIGLALAMRRPVVAVLGAAATPAYALARTEGVLARFERERFSAPLLVSLQTSLTATGALPSQELARLRFWLDRRDERHNQFFAPIAALLMWGTQTACALERWRLRCGPSLPKWIETAGELEALCALAGFAWEHPDAPFPEIVEGEARFEATAIGHPLIASERCVRNDVGLGLGLGAAPQALVMSGSNMSGKSTLLRAVGLNAVLALAGAPVVARRLVLSPLSVAASIRISDSLERGESHFMAEILRLRQVVEIARTQPPALFLLDEILHGTNSHDRRIGAEAVIRGLVAHGALGIVTTHDLALTGIVSGSDGRLANVHLEDHLEDGVMRFDYKLRPGVVAKSNAVALMRSVGLEI